MVKSSVAIVLVMLTCLGFSLVPAKITLAADSSAALLIKDWDKFFPLLFDTAAVLTIKDARIQVASHAPHDQIFILTAHVDDVLTGDLGGAGNIDFVFSQAGEKIFAKTSPADLRGKKLVLAFKHASWKIDSVRLAVRSALPILEISNVFSPFPNQHFSEEDLKPLRRHRPAKIYPYRTCLELRLKRIENRSDEKGYAYPMTAIVTGQILKVLRNNSSEIGTSYEDSPSAAQETSNSIDFKEGDSFRFLVTADQWDKIFPGMRVSDLVGTKCILSFDCGEIGVGGAYRISALKAPFPKQKYSAAQLREMTGSLAASSAYQKGLRSLLQLYIEQRWSKDRIAQFCQSQTRILPRMQRMLLDSHEGVLKGRLYPEAEKELGKISWSCNLEAGMPAGYEIVVDRGKNQFWILEISHPLLQILSDEDVLKYILRTRLYDGWWAYLLVQTKNNRNDLIPPELVRTLIRDDKGNVTCFEGLLANKKVIRADLSEDLEIRSILVDGMADTYWSDICAQENLNIEILYQRELNGSR